jgi:two-component system, chemotaxis family, chemotaxis protein CheY
MKVIVADDSRVMRSIIEKVVQSIGHEAIQASNGKEVLDLLDRQGAEIDLILLDWNMPVMNGLEVLSRMQEKKSHRRIPVLMVSTESEATKREQALKEGARGYLSKPFTSEELTSEIRNVLQESKRSDP